MAFNRRNSGDNGVDLENNGANDVQLEKKAELTALNRKNSDVNSV